MLGCFAISLIALVGCAGEPRESPTKGHLTAIVSESVSPVIKREEQTFEELYAQAKIDLEVATAREAIARLFNDTIKVIVSSRPLNAEERDVAKRAKLEVGEFKIALDGVAIIVNNENPIAQLRTSQLDSILTGRITEWKDVGWKHKPPLIELYLPDRNSGTHEVVATRILRGGNFAVPVRAAQSSPEMLQFVADHPNALGMVGINWLQENKEKVKVLELADPDAPDSLGTRGKYFGPHQAHIYRRYYPLTREVYIYSRADQYGVAAGFIAFITSAAGQKIILNNGLFPATMPVRLVELTNKGI